MAWYYTATRPPAVERRTHLGMRRYTVNYDIEPTDGNDPGGEFRYRSVTLAPGVWSYDAIVSALVSAKYPHDKMDAVVNNYLDDPGDDTYINEMRDMQEWRKTAKSIAKAALDFVSGHTASATSEESTEQ